MPTRFNSADLVVVFQAGEYEDNQIKNSTFEEGDWNGDGDFTTSDLVFAFRSGGYVAAASVAAVDEPWKHLIPVLTGEKGWRSKTQRSESRVGADSRPGRHAVALDVESLDTVFASPSQWSKPDRQSGARSKLQHG